MIDTAPLHEPTAEDRRIRDKWARTMAIVYGMALLLLITFVAANRFHAGPSSAAAADSGQPSVSHATRTDVTVPDWRSTR